MNKTEFEKIQSNINQFQTNEPSYHSSQIKRPIIHFGINDQNILDINKIPNVNQSFNSINEINFSQNSKNNNTNTNINNNINPFKNNDNSGSNLAFYNKSIQQEKYDSIKVFCSKKNDQDNYPLISYENFLLIDSLCEKNSSSNESYQNFLLNKNASIELYSKFCTLLMNRYIISKQNSSINKYPKVVYQIIFDINNVYNYLSKDIVGDAKESNLFIVLVNYQNMFDVAVFNKSNNTGIYFLINRNIKRSIILGLMETINKVVYPEHKFEINISDYSGFSTGNKVILPFIILDFYSRYKNNLPIDDEDYYYQTILILSEILTNNLITK